MRAKVPRRAAVAVIVAAASLQCSSGGRTGGDGAVPPPPAVPAVGGPRTPSGRPSSVAQLRAEAAAILAERIYDAATVYYTMVPAGKGCPTLEDLVREDLIETRHTTDPWGHPPQIRCAGDVVDEVRSAGPDGNPGTEDDIPFSWPR
jgi:hypothetical protein